MSARTQTVLHDLSAARIAAFRYRANPTDEHAQAFVDVATRVTAGVNSIAGTLEQYPELREDFDALVTDAGDYKAAFASLSALQAPIETETASFLQASKDLEAAINGALFGVRMSGDAVASDKLNNGLQAFIRAMADVKGFLASHDPELIKIALPRFAEARSNFDSVAASLTRANQSTDQIDAAIAAVDEIPEVISRLASNIAAQDAVRAERLDYIGPKMQAELQRVVAVFDELQSENGVAAADTQAMAEKISLGLVAASLLMGAVLAFLIGRSISNAIAILARNMTDLAAGETVGVIQGTQHKHELGDMARALEVFQRQAEQLNESQAERQRADEKAAEDRRRMMGELQSAFGAVVDRAVMGDFAGRVPAEFPDAELNQLAEGVNRLLETTNAGVDETARVLSKVAAGDLRHTMEGDFAGAFADLQRDVNNTVAHLSELVSKIGATTRTVRGSSDEITVDAENLSRRAEQQASSLEETAATMEEMSASIKANADGSERANDLALAASQRAADGGAIVENAVSAMNEIEGSAAKIADIISVIDGIAFQTNLLALNAAVEAARAGDAGKGFAVVASEVRALAQRASDAAQDVRSLIETSASQVSQGVKLVTETGASLEGIVSSISEVEKAIKAIAAASSEQATGVAEVSSAISEMDKMTQENASMADQSASKARSLAGGAQQLQSLVLSFQVSDDHGERDDEAVWKAVEAAAPPAVEATGASEPGPEAAPAPNPASTPAPPPRAVGASEDGDWTDF